MDTPTLVIVNTAFALVMACANGVTWRINPNLGALRHWTGTYVLLALCMALFLIRGSDPPLAVIILQNLLAVGVLVEIHWGVRLFYGRPSPWRLAATIIALQTLAIVWFTVVQPNLGARMVVASIQAAAYSGLIAVELLQQRKGMWFAPAPLLGILFVWHGLFCLGRVFGALIAPPDGLLANTPLMSLSFLELFITVTGGGIGFLIITTERLQSELRHAAAYDGLTGVLNRRAFFLETERLLAGLRQNGRPAALLLFDIDHFKRINDSFGHQAGDAVLVALCAAGRNILRSGDLFARYGGEEFCVLLPGLHPAGAVLVAERLRSALSDQRVEYQGTVISATVSVGVAAGDGTTPIDALVTAADAALYRAKSSGRNRVEVAGDDPPAALWA